MGSYEKDYIEELEYLKKTLEFLKNEMDRSNEILSSRMRDLIDSRTDMWEQSAHYTDDFEKLTDMNQHLNEVSNQAIIYSNAKRRVEKYRKVFSSPYFSRFDFVEDGLKESDKIYIGLINIMDEKTYGVLVYDWRSPISSMFYRCEPGRASFLAPSGEIAGEVTVKRQYKIKDSELKYFFDCSIRITDEVLQEVLSRNSSPKMRNIVETIQKEQDVIIRDLDNELLIVQGVAGSGKTSVALHRIAFLLYEGLGSNYQSNNIIIISPNNIFSSYISNVLPELGEENVEETTFDEIASRLINDRLLLETRSSQIEKLILCQDTKEGILKKQSIGFKGSGGFVEIIDRLIKYYGRHMIEFQDIYFDGKVIEKKEILRNFFLNDKLKTPMAKRLKRIEGMILDKIHPLQRKRLLKIEEIVRKDKSHEFDGKVFSRFLSIKMAGVFLKRIQRFTQIDYLEVYKTLFNDKELFYKLSQGIKLPCDIEDIIMRTREYLDKGMAEYEDCAPLMYLKLKLEGNSIFSDIRQVVIDEAQDYYPLQYEVFKLLYKDARYTILGDIHQSLDKTADKSVYDTAEKILNKKRSIKISLNKSYRSCCEINAFTRRLLKGECDVISFDRHGMEPSLIYEESRELIDQSIARDIENFYTQGFESIAVICKTQQEADTAWERLRESVNISLVSSTGTNIEKGIHIIPSCLAKGLEFDVVLIYDGSDSNYKTELDRRLLYVACTRALHRLAVYHTGSLSPFIARALQK